MIKRCLLTGLGAAILGASTIIAVDATEIDLKDNTTNSSFSVKEKTSNTTIAHFSGNGNVGIGTRGPLEKLTIAGDGSAIELGAEIPGKEANAGKIGYQKFTPDALDIVGAGDDVSNRKIKFWNEGGALFRGNIGIGRMGLEKLTIAGDGSAIELGANISSKEANAGKIGYQKFTSDALDIVGAGTTVSNRKIKFWSEGGAIFDGNVGIGTAAPDQKLSVNGEASKVGGGSWATFSDVRLKNINATYNAGLKEVLKLQPIRYNYKADNPLNIPDDCEHVGFSAQDVQELIPDAISSNREGYLMLNNDPIMWAMLNAIKEQQAQIEQLKARLGRFEKQDDI